MANNVDDIAKSGYNERDTIKTSAETGIRAGTKMIDDINRLEIIKDVIL